MIQILKVFVFQLFGASTLSRFFKFCQIILKILQILPELCSDFQKPSLYPFGFLNPSDFFIRLRFLRLVRSFNNPFFRFQMLQIFFIFHKLFKFLKLPSSFIFVTFILIFDFLVTQISEIFQFFQIFLVFFKYELVETLGFIFHFLDSFIQIFQVFNFLALRIFYNFCILLIFVDFSGFFSFLDFY